MIALGMGAWVPSWRRLGEDRRTEGKARLGSSPFEAPNRCPARLGRADPPGNDAGTAGAPAAQHHSRFRANPLMQQPSVHGRLRTPRQPKTPEISPLGSVEAPNFPKMGHGVAGGAACPRAAGSL